MCSPPALQKNELRLLPLGSPTLDDTRGLPSVEGGGFLPSTGPATQQPALGAPAAPPRLRPHTLVLRPLRPALCPFRPASAPCPTSCTPCAPSCTPRTPPCTLPALTAPPASPRLLPLCLVLHPRPVPSLTPVLRPLCPILCPPHPHVPPHPAPPAPCPAPPVPCLVPPEPRPAHVLCAGPVSHLVHTGAPQSVSDLCLPPHPVCIRTLAGVPALVWSACRAQESRPSLGHAQPAAPLWGQCPHGHP